jgi:hypothetical protein
VTFPAPDPVSEEIAVGSCALSVSERSTRQWMIERSGEKPGKVVVSRLYSSPRYQMWQGETRGIPSASTPRAATSVAAARRLLGQRDRGSWKT